MYLNKILEYNTSSYNVGNQIY